MVDIDAAVLRSPSELRIERLHLSEPKPDEVLVDVRATGVCHTDYDRYVGGTDVPFPVVLGHEGAGVVEDVGDRVSRVEPGDHVILSVLPSCGACEFCDEGRPSLCTVGAESIAAGTLMDGTRRLSRDGEEVNHFFAQSSFATKAVVPERSAVPISEDVPFEQAALLGCGATTGLGAVLRTADVDPGDSIAVFGCGGVGTSAVLGGAAVSAGEIIAVDVDERKLDSAASAGATQTIDAGQTDPVERIEELTGGGVEYAFEFVGEPAVMRQAFESTRRGGTTVVTGIEATDPVALDPFELVTEAKTVVGNKAGSLRPQVDIPRYVDMHLRGDIDLSVLLTETHPLSELETAFERMERGAVIRSAIVFD